MENHTKINVGELLNELENYNILTCEKTKERIITDRELARAGLSLIKHSEDFVYTRVQIYGKMEYTYLEENPEIIEQGHLFNPKTPLIILARGYNPSEKFIKQAEKNNIAIIQTKEHTTKATSDVHNKLNLSLAPSIRKHGVLLNVLGIGLLIKGKSGIGKSEVALELIQKGSFLIADDSVEIKQIDDNWLLGMSPKVLQNRMEIRGIGIVDIQKLYGVTSVLKQNKIDLIIELKDFTNAEDRLGNKIEYEDILGVKVQKISLPVLKGRSIANMVEVAIANFQLKTQYNYDSTNEFLNDLNEEINNKNNG